MRLIRLKLTNYRGIEECEVAFASSGITLIQGPNEAGKTSLGESIGLLFEYPDNSKHKAVKAINPVHRDAGPEIELEAESGPYRFTYFKRYHKKPETRLTVTQPNPENLTGREAHDRAEEILSQTLDIDLWKALIVRQDGEISQPDLSGQTWLSAALDRAAGGHSDDASSDDLFDRVRQEHLRYFTEGGQEKKELKEAVQLEDSIRTGIDDLQAEINGLERDIERSAALHTELTELASREKEQSAALTNYKISLDTISTLRHTLQTAELELESAGKTEQEARRDCEDRQTLIEQVASSMAGLEDLQKDEQFAAETASSADQNFKQAHTAYRAAESRKAEAEMLARLRRDDFDYYNNQMHLDLLNERRARVDIARGAAAQAHAALVKNLVDTKALSDITAAERKLIEAKARLETGAPHLRLRGLSASDLDVDGNTVSLKEDEEQELTIANETQITIPGLLEMQITAGSSLEKLSEAADAAQAALDDLCRQVGVADPAAARKAFEERAQAERRIADKERVERDDLRDLTYEEMEQKISRLEANVSGYLENRVKEPAISGNLEAAKTEMTASSAALETLVREFDEAARALDLAREVRDKRKSSLEKIQTEIRVLEDVLKHDTDKLAQARAAVSDEPLQKKLEEAREQVSKMTEAVAEARKELEAENPGQIEALAETSKGSLKTTRENLERSRTELTEVQTRLKINGEEGLHEQLEEAHRRLDETGSRNAALFRRAQAARLLFGTMRAERDESRRAYVAPLKQAIERLGRLVFDDSFQVEIDEDLRIAKRTHLGITVTFDSLSGGTQEQLALIFRLACCIIMAEDGGTPLILDDALGYTDAIRLKTMGAVLAKAAKETQIIIFTCMPARYSDVGEAKVIPLESQPGLTHKRSDVSEDGILSPAT